jgi:phytoene/squalene synthetase
MNRNQSNSTSLAARITKSASKQTYYTIRFLVDRDRLADAYRAYAYFRWVDDILDQGTGTCAEKSAFLNRQKSLLEACYRGKAPADPCAEEWMLVDLVRNDTERKRGQQDLCPSDHGLPDQGLQAYLRNMMEVMSFDVRRCGQVITQAELTEYSHLLATAVTEAMFYFVGHEDPGPQTPTRYLAVQASHVTHMLRDALEDIQAGYYNIPREYLLARGISAQDVNSRAYREWVRERVGLARSYFAAGRHYIAHVRNLRRRLAGFAYTARFEWMLRTIERDHYALRPEYRNRKKPAALLWMGWVTLVSMLASLWTKDKPYQPAGHSMRMDEQ